MVYNGKRVRKTLEDTVSSTVESDISYLYEVDETGFEPSVIASYVYGINLIAHMERTSGLIAYYLYITDMVMLQDYLIQVVYL